MSNRNFKRNLLSQFLKTSGQESIIYLDLFYVKLYPLKLFAFFLDHRKNQPSDLPSSLATEAPELSNISTTPHRENGESGGELKPVL